MIDSEEWLIGREPYGNFHVARPHKYGDPSCVTVMPDAVRLDVKHHPIEVEVGDKKFRPTSGYGIIVRKETVGYGFYSVTCKLPKGANIWCAPLWFHGEDKSTYFELDVCEAYSDENGSYKNWMLGKNRLESNLWYGGKDHANRKSIGAEKHSKLFDECPSDVFTTFSANITESKIEIFYNDDLVRVIDDERILSYLKNKKLNLTIGAGISKDTTSEYPTNSLIVKDIVINEY